jgi:hypothetical protein
MIENPVLRTELADFRIKTRILHIKGPFPS